MPLPDERTRAYAYRVLTAVGAVLVLYKVVTADELTVWLLLAANVLGTGVAAAHTSTKRK
jgi:hypothetical protein